MISQTKQKGFTIVELLIVIVIIGILAAISIVAYNGVTQKARDDQRVSDARNIVNAAASYQAEKGTWPTVTLLQGYDTVKLSGTASSRLGTAAPADTSDTTRNTYQYRFCNNSASGTIAAGAAMGVEVRYWKESPATGETPPLSIKTGSGSRCDLPA